MREWLKSLDTEPAQLVYLCMGLAFLLMLAASCQRIIEWHRHFNHEDYRKPCYKCGISFIYYTLTKLPDTTYHKDRWFCPSCYMELTQFKKRI